MTAPSACACSHRREHGAGARALPAGHPLADASGNVYVSNVNSIEEDDQHDRGLALVPGERRDSSYTSRDLLLKTITMGRADSAIA